MSVAIDTNDALELKLDRCLNSLRRPRLKRWLRSPVRLLSFKLIYEASERFNLPLQGHARTFWGRHPYRWSCTGRRVRTSTSTACSKKG